MVDKLQESKLYIPDQREFSTGRTADIEYRFAIVIVKQTKTPFSEGYRQCTRKDIASRRCVTEIHTHCIMTLSSMSLLSFTLEGSF